eukprot:CAMPEP_0196576350 /NCGR_PEP_ID=MMETSP1081-20130531/5634_1 /TAXON_ID=36882 /ORGANISM="Pyramimonas amylifera, Strain CCMP720" /LENGTH=360 /DNA_ID=CAMNT_0041894933 /DNA_START=245 /DNA_END=1327 /DNA_ORIENTATION=-
MIAEQVGRSVTLSVNDSLTDRDLGKNEAPALVELHKMFKGLYFLKWIEDSAMDMNDVDELMSLDEWVSPFIANDSETSMYSHSSVAQFWRKIDGAFPDMLEFLEKATSKEVESMRDTFTTLAHADVHSTENRGSSTKCFTDLLSLEDRSSVIYWLCHTSADRREGFFHVMNQMVHANKFAMIDKRPRKSSMVVAELNRASKARLATQWKNSTSKRRPMAGLRAFTSKNLLAAVNGTGFVSSMLSPISGISRRILPVLFEDTESSCTISVSDSDTNRNERLSSVVEETPSMEFATSNFVKRLSTMSTATNNSCGIFELATSNHIIHDVDGQEQNERVSSITIYEKMDDYTSSLNTIKLDTF